MLVGRRCCFIHPFIHPFIHSFIHSFSTVCSARWIWHLFISRRCYAVHDLRRQAPATKTTQIPDPRTYLPPAGCPTSFFYPPSRVCLRPSVLRCWRALLMCILPFCNLFPRTYIRRRLIPYYDSGPLHKHQIYIRPIFHLFCCTYYIEVYTRG